MKKSLTVIKIFSLILSAALLCTFITGCNIFKVPDDKTPTPPPDTFVLGLSTAEDGTMLLDGTPIQAFGVNVYDVFINKRMVDVNFDVETPFKSLSESGIRVIRMSIGPYTTSHFARYVYAPDEYFEALDSVIAAAEKYQIGIFASICWNLPVIYNFVGETAESMGDENSKTVKMAKKYYTDVVKRYKDSPAIWAWEFGNEYNLYNDLIFVGIGSEYIITENTTKYYKYISTAMREIDPYRVITGGDSEMSCRPAALRNKHNWDPDDLESTIESTAFYAPSPMEVLSSHMYQYGTAGKDSVRDFDAAIKLALDACSALNKGYYIGEYGPGDFINNGSGDVPQNKQIVDLIHEACLNNNVQIALGWICVTDFTGRKSIRDEFYLYWYDEIVRLNGKLREEGLQDNIDSYWEKAETYIYRDDFDFAQHSDYLLGQGHPGTAYDMTEKNGKGGSWQCNIYDTDSTVRVVDAALPDGSSGPVFKINNNEETSKVMIRCGAISGLTVSGKYKVSFDLKTAGVSGPGLSFKLSTPVFYEIDSIKCDTDGEWQHFEFDVDSPSMGKKNFTISFYFQDQSGEAQLCNIKITDR